MLLFATCAPEQFSIYPVHSLRDLLDGLRQRGFKLNLGPDGTGSSLLIASSTPGGFHVGTFLTTVLVFIPPLIFLGQSCQLILFLASIHFILFLILVFPDTGECQLIVDEKIKLKSGSQIANFTGKGIQFEDGTFLEADIVVFATGYTFIFPFLNNNSPAMFFQLAWERQSSHPQGMRRCCGK